MLDKISAYYLLLTYLIVKRYGNEQRPVTVDQVKTMIEEEFQLENKVDKRTIKEHFSRLQKLSEVASTHLLDFIAEEVGWDEDKEEAYVIHPLTFDEVTLLADVIAFSKLINRCQSEELIQQMYSLIGEDVPQRFYYQLEHKFDYATYNQEVLINVERLSEAINRNNRIELTYLIYDINKNFVPHPVTYYEAGKKMTKERRLVSPHAIILEAHFYYVLCTFEDTGKIYFLRIDQMRDVQIKDEKVNSLPENFDIYDYVKKQPHLFGGDLRQYQFHAKRSLITQIVDAFGPDVRIKELANGEVKVEVESSYNAIKAWLMQYITSIIDIFPVGLKEEITSDLEQKVRELSGK